MQPLKVEGYIYINISSTFMSVRPGLAALPPVPISKINRINKGVNISRKECTKGAGIVLGIQGRIYYF